MSKKPPIDHKDVERGLKAAGFIPMPKRATSHQHWTKTVTGKNGQDILLKVTVDAHLAPYGKDLIKSMASQAGMSVAQFHEICSKEGQKKAKRGLLSWILR